MQLVKQMAIAVAVHFVAFEQGVAHRFSTETPLRSSGQRRQHIHRQADHTLMRP